MKTFILVGTVISSVTVLACSSDEGEKTRGSCSSCDSYQFQGETHPAVMVCKSKSGNSIVDGVEIRTDYDAYVDSLEKVTSCN
ncbi:hypothetical protein JJL45_03235 [Tamlana sp. s12]|uniref:hypothetical protein n=1 Tax=Tamlana sp. s12 TaxID=1630406 RepID=UPI0008020A4E|nr:hypothetical protein [Tamlana sp. s12]OBQ54914.1 hypothetical protein VQ01_09210 [Tamlana sp. s12]QQY83022.1 hypothetical protein JJL45_03235 [Tamlana sp. s12]